MTRVAVLGGSGMLGAMVVDVLSRDFEVVATVRAPDQRLMAHFPSVSWRILDAGSAHEDAIAEAISGSAWAVNCIGIIKSYIHDDNDSEIESAVRVNGLFPHYLGRAATAIGGRVLQVATDCVYSGAKGSYRERDPHDALDVYGKTKSLGESYLPGFHSLRCSIIGPEIKSFYSLLEWFLGQPRGGRVNGFTNHLWNGVTTLHFARLCRAIIANELHLPRLHHVIPTGTISKAEMLHCFARAYHREDVSIQPMEAVPIDRTLSTENPALNAELWKLAGYDTPPTVAQMLEEMAAIPFPWRGRQ